MEAENLFYQCCERIDEDYEVAEQFLSGCIHYLLKRDGEKVSRRMIKDHLKVYNFEPYLRQLRFIAAMHSDSLKALIASSLDLTCLEKQIKVILDHVEYVNMDLVEGSTHHGKAIRSINMLNEIVGIMKPSKQKTERNLSGE